MLESLDRNDRLSDEPDELGGELLRSELLGQLEEERSDDLRLDEESPLATELKRLLIELSCEELPFELEPLLADESLEELGDDRDDSLTLENDLLDP